MRPARCSHVLAGPPHVGQARSRVALLLVTVAAASCGGPPRARYVDPDRPDMSRALPVTTVLGQPATAPAFQALIAQAAAPMTGTGEDRSWTVQGRDFDCIYVGSAANGPATALADVLVWQVHCTKVAPPRSAPPYPGQLPFALTWDTDSLRFSRRMMLHAHPANLEERLLWQGKTEREHRGPRLPAVDEFTLRYRRGTVAPPPPEPELPADFVATHARFRAKLESEGYAARPPQKVRLVPPPGRNQAEATITLSVEVGRRYTLAVWTTFADGPGVAVRTAPTKVRAAELAPHGSAPMSGMLFSLGFRGLQPTAEVLLTAQNASVHTTYYVMLFEERGR